MKSLYTFFASLMLMLSIEANGKPPDAYTPIPTSYSYVTPHGVFDVTDRNVERDFAWRQNQLRALSFSDSLKEKLWYIAPGLNVHWKSDSFVPVVVYACELYSSDCMMVWRKKEQKDKRKPVVWQ